MAGDSGTMAAPLSCMVHSKKRRSTYHQLENEVWKAAFIPTKYIKKMSGIICTCHKYHYHEYIDDAILDGEDMDKMKESLLTELQRVYSDLTEVLKSLLASHHSPVMSDQDLYGLGCSRLIYLFHNVQNGHLTLLNYSKENSDPAAAVEIKHQYQTVFTCDCPRSYIGLVFGKNGNNIKQFMKEHDCSVVMLRGARTDPPRFRLKAVSWREGSRIQEQFLAIIDRVKENREKHLASVQAFQAKRVKRAMFRMDRRKSRGETSQVISTYMAAISLKDNAQKQYETKYQHILKDRGVRQLEKVHPSPNILESSHSSCTNCLLPYSKEEDTTNTQGSCRYHRGYIKLQTVFQRGRGARGRGGATGSRFLKWTCCEERIQGKSGALQHDSHLTTGCTKGIHIWKPHKKSSDTKKHDRRMVKNQAALE